MIPFWGWLQIIIIMQTSLRCVFSFSEESSLEAAPRFQFLLKMKNPNFRWDLHDYFNLAES